MRKAQLGQIGQHGVDRADLVQLDDVQPPASLPKLAVAGAVPQPVRPAAAVPSPVRQRHRLSATASSPPVFSLLLGDERIELARGW